MVFAFIRNPNRSSGRLIGSRREGLKCFSPGTFSHTTIPSGAQQLESIRSPLPCEVPLPESLIVAPSGRPSSPSSHLIAAPLGSPSTFADGAGWEPNLDWFVSGLTKHYEIGYYSDSCFYFELWKWLTICRVRTRA